MPESKVVLVTGASSGFGKETITLLSEHGFQVFGTSRKLSAKGAGARVDMLQLDVDSDESVNNCVSELMNRAGRLDVLVNNAGYVLKGAIEETSVDEAKSQFETNFFGAVRMVRAVLPIMRKQGSGQIINISSMAAIIPVPFEGYYAATKAALLAYTEQLRYEVKNFGVNVSVLEPGFFRTNIGETRGTPLHTIRDYDQMRTRAITSLKEEFQKGGDPKLVAQTILKIIRSESPRFEYLVGKSGRYRALKRILPQSMMESGVRRHWRLDN